MLTPNEVRDKLKILKATQLIPGTTIGIVEIYEEVLFEIATGSIDAKSLAIAVLEPTDLFSKNCT